VGTIQKVSGFLDDLMKAALGEARQLGAKAAHSVFGFLESKEYFKMGKSIGEVIGGLLIQVLLLVFSEAIGNLVTKGAALLGKAADLLTGGKATVFFREAIVVASKFLSVLRKAVKGSLKIFKPLVDRAIEAFDGLEAVFKGAGEVKAGETALAEGVALPKGHIPTETPEPLGGEEIPSKMAGVPQTTEEGGPVKTLERPKKKLENGVSETREVPKPKKQRKKQGKKETPVGEKPSSKILGKNLGTENKLDPGDEAHHIVAGEVEKYPEATEARKILNKAEVGINDAENGAWLPGPNVPKNKQVGRALHRSLNNAKYHKEVLKRLRRATDGLDDGPYTQAVKETLTEIKVLLNNNDPRFLP
jgi:hypothetical protein